MEKIAQLAVLFDELEKRIEALEYTVEELKCDIKEHDDRYWNDRYDY